LDNRKQVRRHDRVLVEEECMSIDGTWAIGQGAALKRERTYRHGGYAITYHARTAGKFGCDPCLRCGRRPQEGETVWLDCYGDLLCNDHEGEQAT